MRQFSRQRNTVLAGLALLLGCGGGTEEDMLAGKTAVRATSGIFRDVTGESGVDFVHFTGATGRFYFPEIMGAGLAVFDYDGDGDLDLYLLQGAPIAGSSLADALFSRDQTPPRNRLYRNDLSLSTDGTRDLRFTDVTETSGTGSEAFAMGLAVGDIDGDGDQDLYVTNFGPNVLYRNNADGTFTDVSVDAGVADPRWTASASFLDYDADGDLDLFHTNYVAFSEDVERVCRRPSGDPDYCTPLAYRPLPDVLYRNDGGGSFEDVTDSSGIALAFGNGLGVRAADFNQDGWTDIYVANDGVANQLWINRGNGTFAESALLSGAALNEGGQPEAGMGIAAGDLDADGDIDLFLSHLFGESNTLYLNQGNGVFADQTSVFALGSASRRMTGFGTQFVDFDGDGPLDIIVVNGAVTKVDSQLSERYPYMMPNQLFRQSAPNRFEDLSAEAGGAFVSFESSRGLAVGDLDLDGDVDLVLTNSNGSATVLSNEVGQNNSWLAVTHDPRSPTAQVVMATRSTGDTQSRHPHTDGSYCSARDEAVYFGLGPRSPELGASSIQLNAVWSDGLRTLWRDLPVDSRVIVSPTREPRNESR